MKSTPDIVHYSLPILYRGFLASQKPSTTTEFSMFCKLCSVIGVISQSPDCPEKPDVPWQPVLDSLQILLETRLTLDLYNTTSDNSTGLVQYTWYQNLLSLLLSFPQSHLLSWFGCIHVLLKKNHLILDKNLVMVCRKVWIEVDCDDKDLNTTQYALLCDLMETYTKLRQ
ncbi:unhealthy ribosome biogenesis protein 2 homolog, partial [Saccoglossus kowalevskii]